MTELSAENAVAFLRARGWIGSGPATAEVLSGGVSNMVLRIEADGQRFVLKQARAQLRTADPWFSDLSRIHREIDAQMVLQPLLPAGTVPAVLHQDRSEFVYLMEHAPAGAVEWRQELLAGKAADPVHGESVGRILGAIHAATIPDSTLDDRTAFEQLRVEPYYERTAARRPNLAPAIGTLIARMRGQPIALCHGDFSPKNLLRHPGGFTLVDHETAHRGDPSMDLGFFLTHLLLKTVRHAPNHAPLLELTTGFWRGYGPVEPERLRAVFGHLGVCLLVRVEGTSPVTYLPEEPRRAAVQRLAVGLLLEPPGDWDEVRQQVAAECVRLT